MVECRLEGGDVSPDEIRERALQRWSWRGEIQQQVVNTDIDGLLTGALLPHVLGWPIVGFNDTETIWVDETARSPLDLRETAWVDLSMCMMGARCIDNHIVSNTAREALQVYAFRQSVNPNLVVGRHRLERYEDKYPFGTFQWAAWLLDMGTLESTADDPVRAGLAWMPDGGFRSIRGPFRRNCIEWSRDFLAGGVLSPVASTSPDEALGHVQQAERFLRQQSGVTTGWGDNHQWSMRSRGLGLTQPDHVSAQRLLDAITGHYGWRPMVLPTSYRVISRQWNCSKTPPPGWPASANRGEVISLAAWFKNEWAWTAGPMPM